MTNEMVHISEYFKKYRAEKLELICEDEEQDLKQVNEKAYLKNIDPSQISQTQFNY